MFMIIDLSKLFDSYEQMKTSENPISTEGKGCTITDKYGNVKAEFGPPFYSTEVDDFFGEIINLNKKTPKVFPYIRYKRSLIQTKTLSQFNIEDLLHLLFQIHRAERFCDGVKEGLLTDGTVDKIMAVLYSKK